MKKGKHTEEQIIGVLKQVEAGRTVKEVARELGVSEATIYTWKSKYGGMEVSEARRLKELEDENRRLKHMVADLSLDKEALKAVNLQHPTYEAMATFPCRGPSSRSTSCRFRKTRDSKASPCGAVGCNSFTLQATPLLDSTPG
jgi:putative transposase